MILCDIGNTSIKVFKYEKIENYYKTDTIPSFSDEVFYISVNKIKEQELLEKNPKAQNLEKFINFETKYKGMGIDRVVACLFCENALIIDAGSAITVDIIENSKHIGGFILLGLTSIKNAYKDISPILEQKLESNINLDKIPLQTKDAISYATLKSIILPINEIKKDKNIVITGGDGELLSQFFTNCTYKKDLIFENMRRIIDANNCIAKG